MYNKISIGGSMNRKGFTLTELLIVMVIVGVLATIAIPKYRTTLEHGRAVEGINNLKAASDAINAHYVLNENNYKNHAAVTDNAGVILGDFTKSVYFSKPQFVNDSSQDIVIQRENNDYKLTAHNVDGEMKYITCVKVSGPDTVCEEAGFEKSGSEYKMNFAQ